MAGKKTPYAQPLRASGGDRRDEDSAEIRVSVFQRPIRPKPFQGQLRRPLCELIDQCDRDAGYHQRQQHQKLHLLSVKLVLHAAFLKSRKTGPRRTAPCIRASAGPNPKRPRVVTAYASKHRSSALSFTDRVFAAVNFGPGDLFLVVWATNSVEPYRYRHAFLDRRLYRPARREAVDTLAAAMSASR